MIAVVHLVWAPLGVAPLREFLRSYRANPAQAEHELVISLNGAGAGGPAPGSARAALLAELEGVEHRLLELERPVLDLAAYDATARLLEHEHVCFLNSYCVIQAGGWLRHLQRALALPQVGLAATSGSWESQAEWVRGRPRYWAYQLARLRAARSDYPRFPNPHVRTSAFMLPRASALEMGMDRVADKRAAYLLESGHGSVTRQVEARGLRAVVVARDGSVYDVPDWPRSRTYRSGGQSGALIADNRTRDWERASPRLRRRLSRDAFGREALI